MSDRSYAAVTFYRCTPEQWQRVLSIFEQNGYFLTTDWPAGAAPLGEELVDHEVGLGQLANILTTVAREVPGVIFDGYQGEAYEYLGDRIISTGDGFWHGELDNAGDVQITREWVIEALAEAGDDAGAFLAKLDELCGVAPRKVISEFAGARASNQATV